MMDLSKLTPAPWTPECDFNETDFFFIPLARNAFDVMMRRGWEVVPYFPTEGWNRWTVRGRGLPQDPAVWSDPFTALVEADKWFRDNVENK